MGERGEVQRTKWLKLARFCPNFCSFISRARPIIWVGNPSNIALSGGG
ncbi:hypothetical protein B0813_001734 [Candidatus Fervidibacteria bacterium JGI MDM2 SSWTFF-3-K9]|jgi:hypothetical protein